MSSAVTFSQPAHRPVATRVAAKAGGRSRLARFATSGIAWGFFVSALAVAWTVFGFGGRTYYGTALSVRAYEPAHRLLRPSGPIGQSFGVFGTVLLLVPFIYMARKRIKRLSVAGSANAWLEVHLFCGVVGPVLITLHTTFKFNGIISAAYWSMVIVMLSGFVGRYLYVRIPRSIRGNEMTRAEVDAAAADLRAEIAQSSSDRVLRILEDFERDDALRNADRSIADLLFGEIQLGRRLRALDRSLAAESLGDDVRRQLVGLTTERAMLLRQAAHLQRTKKLFSMWHIFHLPLVYLLLVIATAHIGVALYMGYVPFRW